ncbi:MAG: hypothetical protein A3F84_20240 [Candidatus Handelsmanbacteria bacterium RIFCSPLOWO2_12_FULL_64_10]|uniref:Uncharacterized protein n=1 Tax=Handelsmanbacteria sp. (strain RIFCSPLOWO2_12_FULL_64_10) TaxID=1817868 RepID=A0A1F6C4Q7_HANXR|nr:MAG: hypothetical protein A3F84_20240 [Candidatus Handelsmanbacteria bacterium RIFCSPLOWO2_12_FULL_64_10]
MPAALWAMDRVADFTPAEVGVNTTVTFRESPAGIVAVAGDTLNCEESLPVTVMPVTDRLAQPGLERIKVFCAVAPTFVLSKGKDEADSMRYGAGLTRRMR